jgi:hypothetical protein
MGELPIRERHDRDLRREAIVGLGFGRHVSSRANVTRP